MRIEYSEEFPRGTLAEAKMICFCLGEGWRLPYYRELSGGPYWFISDLTRSNIDENYECRIQLVREV